jgi:hypothetical protein
MLEKSCVTVSGAAAVLTLLALCACGKGGGAGSTAAMSLGTTVYSGPSAPGLFVVGPSGLQLPPGGTALVSATLVDGAGAAMPSAAAVAWTSSTPEIVQVTADGKVTAVAPGLGQLTATDGIHGPRGLAVLITNTPATGATGATFEPAVVHLEIGGTALLKVTLHDAAGKPVLAPGAIELTTDTPSALTIAPDGTLTAAAPGLAVVWARIAGADLDGTAFVMSGHPTGQASGQAPTDAGAGAPIGQNATTAVIGCQVELGPYAFTKPMMSKTEIRVLVWREPAVASGGPSAGPTLTVEGGSLDADSSVFGLAGNFMQAKAAGSARVTIHKGSFLCGTWIASVGPDLAGPWTGTCGNGDTSTVIVGAWPEQELYRTISLNTYLDRQLTTGSYVPFGVTSATSCVHGKDSGGMTPYACQSTGPAERNGSGSAGASWAGYPSRGGNANGVTSPQPGADPGGGLCADNNACRGLGLIDCGGARHSGGCVPSLTESCSGTILGPDHVTMGTCDYHRGGTCDAPAVDPGCANCPPDRPYCDQPGTPSAHCVPPHPEFHACVPTDARKCAAGLTCTCGGFCEKVGAVCCGGGKVGVGCEYDVRLVCLPSGECGVPPPVPPH